MSAPAYEVQQPYFNSEEPLWRQYLKIGWWLLPLHSIRADGTCTCGKGDACHSPGKHPRVSNGVDGASNDPAVVEAWLQSWPDMNFGVVTGPLIVIDVDVKNGVNGVASLAALAAQHGGLTPTLAARTGSGGFHLLYTRPERHTGRIGNSAGKIGPGIDVRGERGYIVVAPSNHKQGTYAWLESPAPAPLQDWLLAAAVASKPKGRKPPRAQAAEAPSSTSSVVPERGLPETTSNTSATPPNKRRAGGRTIVKGKRHGDLLSIATAMKHKGKSLEEIRTELKRVNLSRCAIPLEDAEFEDMATWAAGLPCDADDVPEIVIGTDEWRVNDEALAALARLLRDGQPVIYRRGSFLARPVRSAALPRGVITHDANAPSIEEAGPAWLGETLSRAARFVRCKAREDGVTQVPAHPPAWTVKGLIDRLEYPELPHLQAVVEAPVLLSDGSVLETPGYHADSGILYLPSAEYPPVPSDPSSEDVRAAVALLSDVIADFPFASEAHKAAALTAIIAPHARHAHAGPSPLVLIDASTAAAGKGLLANVIGFITLGRLPGTMAHVQDEAEQEKRIAALGMGGARLVIIDNIVGVFGGASLCAALTTTVFSGRILGRSETVSVPMLIIWLGTGNNVQLAPDMSRRTLHIRLEPQEECPEERTGFKHPDLMAFVAAERPRLVVAALTILRAHALAGSPDTLSPWGSFEGWSHRVRAAVAWATGIDPGTVREALRTVADSELANLRALVNGWAELVTRTGGRDASAREAVGILYPDQMGKCPPSLLDLRDAIDDLCRAKPGYAPSPTALGKALARFRRRIVDGRALDGREDRNKVVRWQVVKVDGG